MRRSDLSLLPAGTRSPVYGRLNRRGSRSRVAVGAGRRERAQDMTARRPDFFIVGAPKCGTTSLHRWLVGHPQVFMPLRPKEPHYFVQDRLARFGMRYPEDLKRYLSLFDSDAARAATRAGE